MKTFVHFYFFFFCNQTGAFSLLIFVVNSVFIHSDICKGSFDLLKMFKNKNSYCKIILENA